ncbi:membrane protein insertion efficiency factor YidD [Paramesorhizobium deserti]|uniref:Putative membrane protein insertion efficiency factor n=1 Tax=Paramesorhizobium deserti TaxID=1494590 RepID=A0A135HW21_9HYPH|nr:membrane protein insertion efficiency factor YidD [Paramesorhizobium deserti]KXF77399.1 membrane protein insertion efficiency factor YidD [Paramesorhizobium deserti]
MCHSHPHDPATARPKRYSRNFDGSWHKTPDRLVGTALVRLYQLTLSGFIGNSCRHLPTCSEYAYEAIARHGLWAGGWMGLFRVMRCGPGGTHGLDPVPETLDPEFAWYLPWRYWRCSACKN